MDASICTDRDCRTALEVRREHCPRCGAPMRRPRGSAVRGWLLVGLGLFLVVFMGVIAIKIAPQMLHPGKEIEGTTFTGTSDEARLILALFASVVLFGAISVAYGLFMIVTGRQSRTFVTVALALVGLLYAIGWAIRSPFG